MTDSKVCQFCGREFTRTRESKQNWKVKRFCDKKCAGHYHGDTHKMTRAEIKAYRIRKERERLENSEGKRAKVIPPRKWKSYDDEVMHPLNVEQRQLDMAVDNRYNMKLECRVIKPWDADFEELCKQITPIERVKKTERQLDTFCSDIDPSALRLSRRNENTKESRG